MRQLNDKEKSVISEIKHSVGFQDSSQNLMPPWLFQAPHQVLDLINLNPGDPVVVSVFLRDANAGERFSVSFGGTEKDAKAAGPNRFINDVTFERSELPPLSQACVVSYSFRGQPSAVTIALTDSSQTLLSPYLHTSSFCGAYVPGWLDAWLLPVPYRLTKETPVIRSIGTAPPSVDALNLRIARRAGDNQPMTLGDITFDKVADAWNVNVFEDIDLERGDLLSIEMLPGPVASFGFSVCL